MRRSTTVRASRAALAVLALLAFAPSRATAYNFEVLVRSLGQASELRSIRFSGPDLTLSRRRFTQLLSLRIWDLLGRESSNPYDPELKKGPNAYFTTYMRIDHDFGDFTSGGLAIDNEVFDAIDLIPELESRSLQLDVLFAYFTVQDLAGDLLDLHIGRQMEVGSLEWWSMDGARARLKTPWRFAVEGFGGLRVRQSSTLGSSVHEPDGTSGGRCEAYVAGDAPGSGGWRPIDLDPPMANNPFRNDFDLCPQREQLMPTFGGAIMTRNMDRLFVRVAYRRTVSATSDYYPDELDPAPWGVNEEVTSATVRAPLDFSRGEGQVVPYAALRYSLLHGLLDQAHAGVHARYGNHAVEPEVYYSFPTFDGDSIFNVFSAEPYTDARLTYDYSPRRAPLRTYVRGWARRYQTEDADRTKAGVEVDDSVYAGGAQVGIRYLLGRGRSARLDAFHEDGYGGRRTGAYASARAPVLPRLTLAGRITLIDFDEDSLPGLEATTLGVQAGGTLTLGEGIGLSLLAEYNTNRFNPRQLALFGVLDFAFQAKP